MSYSQYRQRNESGKTVPLGTSLLMSSRKESNNVSEDEQSTQEGTFTGYNNRSSYQPLSSMKRNSKMGRLKTAPVRLYVLGVVPYMADVIFIRKRSLIAYYHKLKLCFNPLATYTPCNY